MKIQLKRSNVLDGGQAKEPTAAQMEYGELAVNYSDTDPVLFIKDSNDAIVRIAGAGSSGSFDGDYNNLTNKPTIGDGTLTINNSDGSEAGVYTANQVGPTTISLPAGFSGDYDDLSNLPTIGDGTLTINDSAGNEVGVFTANQVGPTTVSLPAAPAALVSSVNTKTGDVVLDAEDVGALAAGDNVSELANDAGYITTADLPAPPVVNDGKITIVDADGGAVGEFTVNQAGDTEITLPEIPETTGFVKLDDDGTKQSIIGGGGLDVAGGITSQFGTSAAQLGNVAPLNDWSCYPALA